MSVGRTIVGAACTFVVFLALAVSPVGAVTSCKIKNNPRTGELRVSATGISGVARWGTHPGFLPQTQGIQFYDQATCCVGGSCSNCHLGAPGTLAERMPPATCEVCVGEAAGPTCCTIIKGCTPGMRVRDASFGSNDPRYESVEVDYVRPTLRFVAVNVQIVDGSGSTVGSGNGAGLGNLIVGYNEDTPPANVRTGAHNLIVGPEHSWSSYGGFIAGSENTVDAPYGAVSGGCLNAAVQFCAAVSGGIGNTASGAYSSVSGGQQNIAAGNNSAISGGSTNRIFALGSNSVISGGLDNIVSGNFASISGGGSNVADGSFAWIGGGSANQALGTNSSISGGTSNVTDAVGGGYASISGGNSNLASGPWSWIGGGDYGEARGSVSAVVGGRYNLASGMNSAVSGGDHNVASGAFSSASGGAGNIASGDTSWVSGGNLNVASGSLGSVSGGLGNEAGPTFQNASVSGGSGIRAGGPTGTSEEWHAGASASFPTFGPPFGPGAY